MTLQILINRHRLKIAAAGVALFLVLAAIALGLWLANPYPALPPAENSLISDSVVQVHQEPWLIFEPRSVEAKTGLILYPGGRVDPKAYGPAARALAEQGFLIVIVPMPANLAVLAPESADEVIEHFGAIESWAIGGHSLGGAMAARYADSNPDFINGLVLWASYPARSNDLSDLPITATVIYGTQDGLATTSEILNSGELLPVFTRFEAIEGGNHAQFGWYGPQSGDGQAKISHEAQQQRIIEATSQLLREISGEHGGRLPMEPSPAGPFSKPMVKMIQVRETMYVR